MRKERKIGKVVLSVVGIAGLIVVASVVPNALQALTIFGIGKKKYSAQYKYKINKAIDRLQKKKMIRLVQKNGKKFFELTKLGEREFARFRLEEFKPVRPQKWDKKWRLVIFDIKEYKRHKRDELRSLLIKIGFIKLQGSVWVYPYECQDLIFLLKTAFSLGKEVLYITAEDIENDIWLKKKFKLT